MTRLLILSFLLLGWVQGAWAQGLRMPAATGAARGPGLTMPQDVTTPAGDPAVGTKTGAQAADFIVAVVNFEPITNQQVRADVERIRRQMAAQKQPVPDAKELIPKVLEQMINERAQLQVARETGIKINEPSVDQAEDSIAKQNQLTLDQLHEQLAKDGIDPKKFRDQLRDQLTLNRLREREVDNKVVVSDAEVDQYLADQKKLNDDPVTQTVNMAHILVAVPDGATAQDTEALKAKAQEALKRARAGEDFASLAKQYSDAADRTSGGVLGLRTGDRYPTLFLEATRALAPGDIADLVRSGAGFHVIKLLERRNDGMPPATVVQTHARHILLVPSAKMTEAQARDQLKDFRRRILSGQTDFMTLAKQYSQDASASSGGDLGWANPGMFVPEFERVLDQLNPGQISEPLISRFGVHLIQLIERRKTALTDRDQREMIRYKLREKKHKDALEDWTRDIRVRAYVDMREPPIE